MICGSLPATLNTSGSLLCNKTLCPYFIRSDYSPPLALSGKLLLINLALVAPWLISSDPLGRQWPQVENPLLYTNIIFITKETAAQLLMKEA